MTFSEMLAKDAETTLKKIEDVLKSHLEGKLFYCSSVTLSNNNDKLYLHFLSKDDKYHVKAVVEEEKRDDDTNISASLRYEDDNEFCLDAYTYMIDYHEPLQIETILEDVCDEIEEWIEYENGEKK